MNSFGKQLSDYRRSVGLTQRALAEKAGLTASYLNRIEKGTRRPPKVELVQAIASALRLTLKESADFMELAGYSRFIVQPDIVIDQDSQASRSSTPLVPTECMPDVLDYSHRATGKVEEDIVVESRTKPRTVRSEGVSKTMGELSASGSTPVIHGANTGAEITRAGVMHELDQLVIQDPPESVTAGFPDHPAITAVQQILRNHTAQRNSSVPCDKTGVGHDEPLNDDIAAYVSALSALADIEPSRHQGMEDIELISKIALEVASANHKRHNYATAERWLEMALRNIEAVKVESADLQARTLLHSLRTRIHIRFVAISFSRGDIKRALERAKMALAQLQDQSVEHSSYGSSMPQRVDLLSWLAELHEQRAESSQADSYVSEAMALLEGGAWPKNAPSKAILAAHVYRVRGTIKTRQGDWDQAISDFQTSMNIAIADPLMPQEDFIRLKAWIARDRCYLRIRQGQLKDAIREAQISKGLRFEVGDDKRAWAHYSFQIADIYRADADRVHPRLSEYLFEAIERFKSIGNEFSVAQVYLRLSRFYRTIGLPRHARYWASCALDFGREADMPFLQALAHRQYGKALEGEADIDWKKNERESLLQQAEDELRKSVSLLRNLQDSFELAMSRRALGELLANPARTNPDRYLQAQLTLEAARDTFDELGAPLELAKTEEALIALHTKLPRS